MPLLFLAFLLTAALYASVGFGGGSTYTALLALSGLDYRLIPILSLLCNLVVVSGGAWRYVRAGEVDWRRVLPIVLLSAPFAWLGGLMPIKQAAFMLLLGASLAAAGFLLLFQKDNPSAPDETPRPRAAQLFDLSAGAATGFLAGVVGIGGGIFLAPLLHLTRWGAAKRIAATACLFIFVNSLAGLAGQVMKHIASGGLPDGAWNHWPLMLAVLIGGQFGSFAGIRLMSAAHLRKATALLILFVAGQILWKQFG